MPDIRKTECPPLLGLFQKRIEGDDALMRLAQLRFRQAGLGVECYAESRSELKALMGFLPTPGCPVIVHLSRDLDVLSGAGRKVILDFAASFRGRVLGLVIHDQPELVTRRDQVLGALREIGAGLRGIPDGPMLFLEYAAGHDPALFVETLRALRDSPRVSGCLDVGHLGLWQVRRAYSRRHPGVDACGIKPWASDLPSMVDDLQGAVESALDQVLQVIHAAADLGKPLHFHLHDGHPLSTASQFGVSDHLSFLEGIPIPFEHRGRRELPLMFGPSGLASLVEASIRLLGPRRLTYSLEIHPTEGRLPLGDASHLFHHWVDKTNAERMNHWLAVLLQNHELLKGACDQGRLDNTQGS